MKVRDWARGNLPHHARAAAFLILILYLEHSWAAFEQAAHSTEFVHGTQGSNNEWPLDPPFETVVPNNDKQTFTQDCNEQLQYWMYNVSKSTVNQGDATLIVDWSELDSLLKAHNCPYTRLWLELWRVKADKEPPGLIKGEEFGSPEYFSKYERCNKLDETLFAFHSTRAHDGSAIGQHIPQDTTEVNVHRVQPQENSISMDISTVANTLDVHQASTFLHIVEESYILRLCPCGMVRKNHMRVCDCKHTSALCSSPIKIQQPPEAAVFPWCRPDWEDGIKHSMARPQGVTLEPLEKTDFFELESPAMTCHSILLAGSITSCTPIQAYDRIRVSYCLAFILGLVIDKGIKQGLAL